MDPEITENHIIQMCESINDSRIYIFSEPGWTWEDIAQRCGGIFFELTRNRETMYGQLMQILSKLHKGDRYEKILVNCSVSSHATHGLLPHLHPLHSARTGW